MKSGILLICLSMGLSSAQDTIVLKNGRKADCKIIDFTANAVKIIYRATPAAAPAERLIPLVEIDHIDPAPFPGETEARATAIREGRSEPLMIYWVKHLPWLGRGFVASPRTARSRHRSELQLDPTERPALPRYYAATSMRVS